MHIKIQLLYSWNNKYLFTLTVARGRCFFNLTMHDFFSSKNISDFIYAPDKSLYSQTMLSVPFLVPELSDHSYFLFKYQYKSVIGVLI